MVENTASNEKYGIDEFEEALVSACKFTDPLLDGFQLKDIGPLAMAFTTVPGAIKGAELIPLEVGDLSAEELVVLDRTTTENLPSLQKFGERAKEVKERVQNFVLAFAALALTIKSVDVAEQ